MNVLLTMWQASTMATRNVDIKILFERYDMEPGPKCRGVHRA